MKLILADTTSELPASSTNVVRLCNQPLVSINGYLPMRSLWLTCPGQWLLEDSILRRRDTFQQKRLSYAANVQDLDINIRSYMKA
jgi:hypothetical protein